MKSATIPSIRVEPTLRADLEALLGEGETLSEFVETSVREAVQKRRNQLEFLARGLESLAMAKQSGLYVDADTVIARLDRKLAVGLKRRAAGNR